MFPLLSRPLVVQMSPPRLSKVSAHTPRSLVLRELIFQFDDWSPPPLLPSLPGINMRVGIYLDPPMLKTMLGTW